MTSPPKLGTLTAGRRYLQTVVAEAGDVDISKQTILISIGRGIQDAENVAIAQELADAMGGAVSCSRPVVDAKWMAEITPGRFLRPNGKAQGLHGLRHQWFLPALGRTQGKPVHRCHQQESKAPIFQVADVGIVADILEFMPQLTNKIRAL